MGFITARVRDAEWLAKNNLNHLNLERFSDWVTRETADGKSESDAHQYVAEKMAEELKK